MSNLIPPNPPLIPPAGDDLDEIYNRTRFDALYPEKHRTPQLTKAEFRAQLTAYILSEIQKAKPEKRDIGKYETTEGKLSVMYDEQNDELTNRNLEYLSSFADDTGYNQALDDYEQALTTMFGGTA